METTEIAEQGYRDTTIADIVRTARTSKRTFYQEFPSKEQCFIELLWTANNEMIEQIRTAVDPQAFWQDQIRQAATWIFDKLNAYGVTVIRTAQLDEHRLAAYRAMEESGELMIRIQGSWDFNTR